MLAGRIKLRNFLLVVAVVVTAGVFGLVKACSSSEPADPPIETSAVAATSPSQTAPIEMGARGYDAEVLGWAGRSIDDDKQKDVSKGKPYKINVYRDVGASGVNRAKVDVDRDDKWDEKYTFEADKITLQIAPDDDETYTATYRWTGRTWSPERGTAVVPRAEAPDPPVPPKTPDLARREYDLLVIGWKDRAISGDKAKDAIGGHGYKVNFYKDAGAQGVNRAKVDLDRDDKWDEKYTFESGGITLQRAPADDEQYTETYHWSGSGWIRQ